MFGAFNTSSVGGITATLQAWPAPALKTETVELLDGAFYARTGLAPIAFAFDVLLSAATPAAVHALRDQLIAGCAPTLGVQALTPETGEGWRWWATCSGVSDFQRGLWLKGIECQLRCEVSFLVPDGVGWADPDETASGGTSATIARSKGNLPSYPCLTIEGDFEGVQIAMDGFAATVDIPVTTGQRLVLDYQAIDYGVWAGSVKVAHAAPGMDTFERPTLPLGSTTVTATAITGSVAAITIDANSRRA